MQQFYKKICLLTSLLILTSVAYSQNVEGFFKDIKDRIEAREWVKMNGSISALGSFNSITGIERRFDPFSYRLNLALNLDILGIQAPFTASISDGNKVYKLPAYAFYGVSPSYKWIKLHLGDRAMNFSPYTLSGHHFRGLGMELKPGKFRFAAMYGELKKAVAEDLDNRNNLETTYRRLGWGVKTGYENKGSSYHLILFQAKDEPNSIPILNEQPATLRPQDNTIMSFIVKQKLGELLNLSVDYALSGLTRDTESSLLKKENFNIIKRIGGLYHPKASSGFYNAFKTQLGVKTKIGQVSFNYEWIDPGYKTLGALYIANDLENFTTGITTVLFKEKVTLSANVGLQRNNLSQLDDNTNNRFLGAINLGIKASEKMNVNITYSNSSATNKLRAVSVPFVQVDSLILVQTNQSASFNSIYTFKQTEDRQSIFLATFSYQNANSIENETLREDQTTTFYMGQLSYIFGLPQKNWDITTSLLVNYGQIPTIDLLTFAPNITMKWQIFDEKMDIATTFNYSTVLTNKQISNKVLATRLNIGYQLFEQHQLNFSFNFTNNNVPNQFYNYPDFTETTGTIMYNWRF